MAILLSGWILTIGGDALGRVCVCSLRSRLVTLASCFTAGCRASDSKFPLIYIIRVQFTVFLFPHDLNMETRIYERIQHIWNNHKSNFQRREYDQVYVTLLNYFNIQRFV